MTNLIVAQCPVTRLAGVSSMREEIYDTGVLCSTVNNDTDLNNSCKDLEALYLK